MKKFLKNLNDTYIIAEAGNNHEGNFNIAREMILEAAKAGADAIKFQTYNVKNFIQSKNKKTYRRMKKFQLEFDEFYKLSLIAKKNNINFISTPLDFESAIFLNKIQNVFKISSSDNNHYEFLKLVSSFNKPMIVSTGLIDLSETVKIYKFLKKNIKNFKKHKSISFLHCTSSYPPKLSEINLNSMNILQKKFKDCAIGYSDHFNGTEVAIQSIIQGAQILEKHFTLDKNFSSFRDHKISLNPQELSNLIQSSRNIKIINGIKIKEPSKNEKINIKLYRRSIAAKFNLKKGQIINYSDLIYLRPGIHIQSKDVSKYIGLILNKDIKAGEFILKNDLIKK